MRDVWPRLIKTYPSVYVCVCVRSNCVHMMAIFARRLLGCFGVCTRYFRCYVNKIHKIGMTVCTHNHSTLWIELLLLHTAFVVYAVVCGKRKLYARIKTSCKVFLFPFSLSLFLGSLRCDSKLFGFILTEQYVCLCVCANKNRKNKTPKHFTRTIDN